jgi:hypothetical protein
MIYTEKGKERKSKETGRKGGKKNQRNRKRQEIKRRKNKISVCTGAISIKSREELVPKSANAIAETHHDAKFVTWR